jgi:hypothetical protein
MPCKRASLSIGALLGNLEGAPLQGLLREKKSISGFIYLPMKMEPIESSETSASNTQTPGIYPKERKLYLEHGENLKSRIYLGSFLEPGGH